MTEWGFPKREDVDNLLDAYIEQKRAYRALLDKLEFVLLSIETDDGFYTFPDGESFPAGKREAIIAS